MASAQPILYAALLLVAAVLACCKSAHADDDGFKYGRATFYDDNEQ
jgi:hypothetical protein